MGADPGRRVKFALPPLPPHCVPFWTDLQAILVCLRAALFSLSQLEVDNGSDAELCGRGVAEEKWV